VIKNSVYVAAQDYNWNDLGSNWPQKDVSSPFYTNDGEISDQKWSTIYVPIADMGLVAFGDIFSFYFTSSEAPRPTPIYFDNIKFVNLATTVTSNEPAINAPAVQPTPIQFLNPLGELAFLGAQTPGGVAPGPNGSIPSYSPPPSAPNVNGNNNNQISADNSTSSSLPVWAIATIGVLAALVSIAIGVIVFLVIKTMKAGGATSGKVFGRDGF